MSEREEKLINKIISLQKEHNSLKIEEEKEKYELEIKLEENNKEEIKKEMKKLSSELDRLENNYNDNDSTLSKTKNIVNKQKLLNTLIKENNIKSKQLKELKENCDNFQKESYILNIINNWDSQTMFKYVKMYDKKYE